MCEPSARPPDRFIFCLAFFVMTFVTLQQQIRDISNRQVFHEFEKLQNMPLTTGGANSTGLSPAKSLMQVAMA